MKNPEGSRVVLTKGPNSILIQRPLAKWGHRWNTVSIVLVGVGLCALSIYILILFIIKGAQILLVIFGISACAALLLIILWTIALLALKEENQDSLEVLRIDLSSYSMWKERNKPGVGQDLEDLDPNKVSGKSCNIVCVRVVPEHVSAGVSYPAHITLEERQRITKFGRGLEITELDWLHFEITEFLKGMKNEPEQEGRVLLEL